MPRRSMIDSAFSRLALWHARRRTQFFARAVERATATQDRLLAEVLAASAEGAFGRQHHFAKIRSYADFVANVPIHRYEDLSPYIERVRAGEVGALFNPGERILMFALTSGTTAEPKYIPITPRVLADCRLGWNIWGFNVLLDHPDCVARHIVQVTSPMNDHPAPSGRPCGAITGLLAKNQKRIVRRFYTSPLAIAGIKDATAKYYAIMRLAIPRDVAWAVTANPATLLVLAKTANEHRERLIRDIHDGTLSAEMPVDGAIRSSLAPRLKADAACARRLEAVVSQHGAMYPRHYWQMGFLAHWTGGTMGLYRSQCPKYFGDVPVRDIGLIASEGRMSIPTEDGTAAGTLAVLSQFFEFIPASEYGTSRPTVLRCDQVQEGEAYFLLLTNASGLYRYDVGDRVRVVGRVGEAPVIEFLSRDAHTSSMAGEKLTEDQVVMAMRQVCSRGVADGGRGGDGADPGSMMDSFVLAPRWAEVPRYRLYVEGGGAGGDAGGRGAAIGLRGLAGRLDEALRRVSVEYASKRETLRLESVELAVLPEGFLTGRDFRLKQARARTAEQFKHQYLLPTPGLDDELEAAM